MTGSGWAITQGSTVVNLPFCPNDIRDENPVQIDEFGADSTGTTLISRFVKARRLTLKGYFTAAPGATLTNAQIESTYLAPLRAMARQQVTITDPDNQFNQTGWIMGEPDFERKQDVNASQARYDYTIVLFLSPQGLANVIE